MAKTATERKREQRERDKQSEEERLSRLLSRTNKTTRRLSRKGSIAVEKGMSCAITYGSICSGIDQEVMHGQAC